MKKFLFATSAIVAAGTFAGTAEASEPIKLGLSGGMEIWYGYVANDTEVSEGQGTTTAGQTNPGEVHAAEDTEVHFTGETTLDNGITIRAVIELEGEQSGDQIDEMFMTLSGNFGNVVLGNDDSAADKAHVNGPSSGFIGYDDGDFGQWIESPASNGNSAPDTFAGFTSDGRKITYQTPNFNGLQLGVSYTPQDGFEAANGTGDQNGSAHNGLAAGIGYETELAGASISLSGSYEVLDSPNRTAGLDNSDDEIDVWAVGASVGYGNITVGGAFSQRNGTETEDDSELTSYSIGVGYSMGDASVSLGYGNGVYNAGTTGAEDNTTQVYELGASYTLGAGVAWRSSLVYVSFDTDTTTTSTNVLAADYEGKYIGDSWVLGTGIDLSF